MMDGTCEAYCGSLPTSGMLWRGGLYELATPEHRISGSGCALWPTVRANSSTGASCAPGRQGSEDLQTAVLWSTPAAQDGKNSTLPPSQAVRDTLPGDIIRQMRTTPCAGDAYGAAGGRMERSLRTDTHGAGGQLNPDWVECLMGFPPGWTLTDGQPQRGGSSTDGSRHGSDTGSKTDRHG